MITDGRVPGKINKGFLVFVILLVVFAGAFLFLNGRESPEPSEAELSASRYLRGLLYTGGLYHYYRRADDTVEAGKVQSCKENIPYSVRRLWLFRKPVAYNDRCHWSLASTEKQISHLVFTVEHMETEHCQDMNNSWFTDRFAGKTAENYLKTVKLDSRSDDEVVIITGATVTTDGIVNGVNACMGVYQEAFLGRQAEPVPYMVRFEREEGDGPEETGSVAIRAYGVVLGEVTLEEIQKMPSVKRTLSIHSTAGTTNHSFRGTPLSMSLQP